MPKGQYTRVEGKHYGRPKGSKSKPKETPGIPVKDEPKPLPATIVQDNIIPPNSP